MNRLTILCILSMLMCSVTLSHAQKTYDLTNVDVNYDKNTICIDLLNNLEVTYDETFKMGIIKPILIPLKEENIGPEGDLIANGEFKNICFTNTDGHVKPGVYAFQVLKNGSLDHLIKFEIKAPKPEANLSIFQNDVKVGSLNIDYANHLKAQFEFSNDSRFFEEKKPKIQFQGHELKLKSIELNKLVAELDLSVEQVQKIKLGSQFISLSHSDWGIDEYGINVESKSPQISQLHTIITYTNHIAQVPLKLDAFDVSPNAQICVECDDTFDGCPVTGKCYAILLKENGQISSDINIGLASHGDTGRFKAFIKNGDGKSSEKVNVIVEPLDVTAELSSRDENKPIVSGLKSDVTIINKNGAFDLSKDFLMTIQGKNIPIEVDESSTSSTLFGKIDVPKDIHGAKLKFEIENNSQTWRGQIGQINKIPSLQTEGIVFRRNQEFTLNFDEKVKGVTLVNDQIGVEILKKDISDGIGKLKLTTDFFDEMLSIGVRVDSRDVIRREFEVKEWTSPKSALTIGNTVTTFKNRPIITLNDGEDIIIKQNDNLVDNESNEKIYVQLYNKDGNAVGDQSVLRFRKNEDLKIFPKGFSSGDDFLLEFKTVDEKRETYIGYIQRPFWDRFSFNAGLNGVRFSLVDDDLETPRHKILGGITVGIFYSFERKRPQEKNLFGVGLYGNFSESEDGSELSSSLGIALLLAEKVSIGLDIIGMHAITIGANINILDFSKLLGAATNGE